MAPVSRTLPIVSFSGKALVKVKDAFPRDVVDEEKECFPPTSGIASVMCWPLAGCRAARAFELPPCSFCTSGLEARLDKVRVFVSTARQLRNFGELRCASGRGRELKVLGLPLPSDKVGEAGFNRSFTTARKLVPFEIRTRATGWTSRWTR